MPITGSQSAHLRGFANILDIFVPVRSYIRGYDTAHNTNESSWGPAIDVPNGIINVYNPKQAHISFLITSVSPSRSSFITNYGVILRAETRDGNADIFTLRLDDSSTINNDGVIYNLPTWIEGPHG